MQYSFQTQRHDFDDIVIHDTIRDEDKLFIVNLIAKEITDPEFIVQVKNIRHNSFNNLVLSGGDFREKVPKSRGFLLRIEPRF